MERKDKVNYYLDIAEAVCARSTCLRRKFGAIVVKHDEIISTGYNGAPRGRANCSDLDYCYREKMQVPRGQRYELCRSVHAEANAIISASRADLMGSELYLACHDAKTNALDGAVEPCSMCKRLILNAGIEKVYVRDDADNYTVIDTAAWIETDDSLRTDLPEGY
ncbi:MAG: cytidine deaminase [Oscillospiraceae bacterium]|nr:cytidine deaminase [Oscillospiraceae bacterium]